MRDIHEYAARKQQEQLDMANADRARRIAEAGSNAVVLPSDTVEAVDADNSWEAVFWSASAGKAWVTETPSSTKQAIKSGEKVITRPLSPAELQRLNEDLVSCGDAEVRQ